MPPLIERLEEMSRRVWGDKVFLALVVHTLRGIGIGLLFNPIRKRRTLGFVLIGLTGLVRLWAWTEAKHRLVAPGAHHGIPV